ncbi:MAG TPA: hypothetical protein VGM86_03305 [Thermoanaerobaculia bacterium]|jgi:hypothetical protein
MRRSRPKKKNSKLTLLPPGATKEEDKQLDSLRHPWSSTYGEFIQLVKTRYGFTERYTKAIDPDGKTVRMPFLQSADKARTIELPGNLHSEDQLDEFMVAGLCRRMGLPPQDFGLEGEEPYDEPCDFEFDF